MDMSEESSSLSKPVLKIPSSSTKEHKKNDKERNDFGMKNILPFYSILSFVLKIVPIFVDCYPNRKKKRINFLGLILNHSFIYHITILLVLLLINVNSVECAVGGAKVKHRDEATVLELCKNFTQGNPEKMEFASPQYNPSQDDHFYPQDITCFRTITADYGYFVRIDFRDVFNVEPPSNEGECAYDYLEIRDGDQGYSPLIGMYAISYFELSILLILSSLLRQIKIIINFYFQENFVVISFLVSLRQKDALCGLGSNQIARFNIKGSKLFTSLYQIQWGKRQTWGNALLKLEAIWDFLERLISVKIE